MKHCQKAEGLKEAYKKHCFKKVQDCYLLRHSLTTTKRTRGGHIIRWNQISNYRT